MKELRVFILKNCFYCKKALSYLQELIILDEYQDIKLDIIEENIEKDLANSYDYYYVPSFYADKVKLAEGAVSYDDVKMILDKLLSL